MEWKRSQDNHRHQAHEWPIYGWSGSKYYHGSNLSTSPSRRVWLPRRIPGSKLWGRNLLPPLPTWGPVHPEGHMQVPDQEWSRWKCWRAGASRATMGRGASSASVWCRASMAECAGKGVKPPIWSWTNILCSAHISQMGIIHKEKIDILEWKW